MREILFKGKTIDTGEWVVGRCLSDDVIVPISQEFTIDGNTIHDNLRAYCVDPGTLKQFTGIYDCTKFSEAPKEEQLDWLKFHTIEEWKGRRIFEGDIVHIIGEKCAEANQESCITFTVRSVSDYLHLKLLALDETVKIELVDSIADNPNLIR